MMHDRFSLWIRRVRLSSKTNQNSYYVNGIIFTVETVARITRYVSRSIRDTCPRHLICRHRETSARWELVYLTLCAKAEQTRRDAAIINARLRAEIYSENAFSKGISWEKPRLKRDFSCNFLLHNRSNVILRISSAMRLVRWFRDILREITNFDAFKFFRRIF